MSKLNELIEELCPNGVKYYELGKIGRFYGGLTGKSKNDFLNGNAKFITYKNVYLNPSLKIDVDDKVNIKENENQRTLEYGDIIFTGSSETPDECGISSVLTERTDEKLYLNSFSFIYRLNDVSMLNPHFAKYLFRSNKLRYQIGKTASGVTRYNVSKRLMEKVRISIPPLEVQCEIVHILDNFTEISTLISAELKSRQKQYDFYKEKLLFSDKKIELKEIAEYSKDRIRANDLDKNNYVGVDNLLPNKAGKKVSEYVPIDGNVCKFRKYDTLIGNIRPYLRKIWFADCDGGTNGDVLDIRIKEEYKNRINSKFLYYCLSTENFFEYDNKNSKGAKMPRGNKEMVMKYKIPLLSLDKQERIVNILDSFDKLCNDILQGLPAEIEARQKQYEYYRDKLLNFKSI